MIGFKKINFGEWWNWWEEHISPNIESAKLAYDNIKLPARATTGSAGYDFFCPIPVNIKETYTLIPTGIKFVTDENNVALLLMPKSGLGFKYSTFLSNTVGLIDSDYQYSNNDGHIMIKIKSDELIYIPAGKALIQGIIIPYYTTSDDTTTGIRNGGFGSTGA